MSQPPVPKQYYPFAHDPEKWLQRPETDDPSTLTTKDINTWILSRMELYEDEGYMDDTLWEVIREDLEGWDEEQLKRGDTNVIRKLRDFLRTWGVCVSTVDGTIAKGIERVLKEEEKAPWTEAEVLRQVKARRARSYALQDFAEELKAKATQTTPATTSSSTSNT